jgi:putative alpha-1,2-mannosidase
MSAWYALSTLGLYPVVPSSGSYVLGAPQVRAASLRLPRGARLRIRADGSGEARPHAVRATLNGRALDPLAVPHAALLAGGELRFQMQALP